MAKKIDKVRADLDYVQSKGMPVLIKLEEIRNKWGVTAYKPTEKVSELTSKLLNLITEYEDWMKDDSPAPPDDTPDTPEGNKTGGGKEVH